MSSSAFKPENALKRAEELILVGQSSLAFQNLHDLIMSKRLRFNQINYESIMLRYITLAVNMKKGKYIKEALSQYRNQTLFSNLSSFELVIRRFVETAENKVPSGINVTPDVEDLDSSDTPESVIEKILNGEDEMIDSTYSSRSEGDETATPYIRFLWEAYRISLDVSRNNSKLESFYKFVAMKAFAFCGKFNRKTEFRRLCEVLRNHLIQIAKSSISPTPHITISLLNQESMNVQLHVRFMQLDTAMQLETWPEALKAIEDIYELLSLNKKGTVDNYLMVKYYEALTKIFSLSGNSLFHAAAWNKYLSFVGSQSSSMPPSQISDLTSCAFLSALAVPIHLSFQSSFSDLLNESVTDSQDTQLSRDSKITAMMGLSKIPTRDQLVIDASGSTYWNYIDPDVKSLYEILSSIYVSNDTPLTLSKLLSSILSRLNLKPSYSQFMPLVQRTIFSILFERVTCTLSQISFEDLLIIISNVSLSNVSLFDLELYVLQESSFYSQSYNILIDDLTKCFYIRPISNMEELLSPSNVSTSSELFNVDEPELNENSLLDIDTKLHSLLSSKHSFISEPLLKDMMNVIQQVTISMTKLQALLQAKKELIHKNKLLQESVIKTKESKEALERAEKSAMEQELIRSKRAEHLELQEQERKKNELLEIQLKEKRKLIDQAVQKISAYNKTVDVEAFMKLPREEILKKQSELLAEGKNEVEKKIFAIAKRMDHLERACRQQELVLLKKDHEIQRKINEEVHASLIEKKRSLAYSKHLLQIASIKCANARSEDAHEFYSIFKGTRLAEIAPCAEQLSIELEIAKQKRLSQAIEAYRLKKASQEAFAKKQAEESEAKARFQKQEEMQRAREAEIEQKLKNQQPSVRQLGSKFSSTSASIFSSFRSNTSVPSNDHISPVKGVSKFPGKKTKDQQS